MKPFLLFLSLCLGFIHTKGQGDSAWMMFIDKSSDLIGYKNSRGEIQIEPKFTYLTQQKIFKNIMPVYEKISNSENGTLKYYLLKNGKKVGIDSLYLGEYFLDCESENKIRFRDPGTDKVGFFDKNGQVVIPAMYNEATAFYNGLALTIKDGKRMCWEGGEYSKENPCEHWRWVGDNLLINDKNEVLLDSIDPGKFQNIDFYSMQINPESRKPDFIEFKSGNGDTYAFRDFKKEFEQWFYPVFLKNKSPLDLTGYLFPEITIPKQGEFKSKEINNPKYTDYAWMVEDGKSVLKENAEIIRKILNKINNKEYITTISKSPAPILLDEVKYPGYFSDCGDYLDKKYPYFEVTITNNTGLVLNGLGFIRTTEGYKLLEIH